MWAILAVFLGWQLQIAVEQLNRKNAYQLKYILPVAYLVILAANIFLTRPHPHIMLTLRENDTMQLAEYVAARTTPDELVLSDYGGINFFTNRFSIYEASIIAGAQIDAGVVTGELLIDRIQREPVKMVLLHVDGGVPPPHHLVNLVDYEAFRLYLQEHFTLDSTYNRAGQEIEVYIRNP